MWMRRLRGRGRCIELRRVSRRMFQRSVCASLLDNRVVYCHVSHLYISHRIYCTAASSMPNVMPNPKKCCFLTSANACIPSDVLNSYYPTQAMSSKHSHVYSNQAYIKHNPHCSFNGNLALGFEFCLIYIKIRPVTKRRNHRLTGTRRAII
jgi:hypothetical protein